MTKSYEKSQPVHAEHPNLSVILCVVFFLSGAAAVMFETLWFRLAGLTFGNSVWAGALVLSSFMAGLALGNGLAAYLGHRIRFPIRFYAFIEIAVAVSGIGLVLIFPLLTGWLAPLFRVFFHNPWILNPLRLLISFLLMLIPATAMGMTLPLLVKALYSHTPNYGRVLGKLYGWNTLGAVVGALIPEALFIGMFGIRGTGFCAGLLNLLAAAGALHLSKGAAPAAVELQPSAASNPAVRSSSRRAFRHLSAGFLSGGILLALEVIWFRFLNLYLNAEALVFAIMLSVVLAGIGLGGMLASMWFRLRPRADHRISALALLSGTLCICLYWLFEYLPGLTAHESPMQWIVLPVALMFPVCLLSGVLFTLIGEAVYRELGGSLKTTGLLTMANTTGAMIGSALAGFVLLPQLGMEKSFLVLASTYCGVALFALETEAFAGVDKRIYLNGLAAAAFLLSVALFPFGSMKDHFLAVAQRYGPKGPGEWQSLAVREGLTETSQYWERRAYGTPLWITLFTNNHEMSGTRVLSRRYMKYYVYWPVAVHPNPTDALLICFGVGCTAKALTDSPGFKTIDVVDISRDILKNSEIIYPDRKNNPLYDPRVNIFIEDGRFFLLTTERRYDLITGEPPPPRLAGVVNLYSQEYFQLVYDRLKEGGICTYWLPVRHLGVEGTTAVLKAFSNVFDDCSVWNGTPANWMMVGTRNATGPVSEEQFARQWKNPKTEREMRILGFEKPEQIGATLIMDSVKVHSQLENVLPLTDNFPKRILSEVRGPGYLSIVAPFNYSDTRAARQRFEKSAFIEKLWPETLKKKTVDFFRLQELVNKEFFYHGSGGLNFPGVTEVLQHSSLTFPVKLLLGGTEALDTVPVLKAADSKTQGRSPNWHFYMGVGAAAERDFDAAQRYFAEEYRLWPRPYLLLFRAHMLCLAGRLDDAQALVRQHRDVFGLKAGAAFVNWLSTTFGMKNPFAGHGKP